MNKEQKNMNNNFNAVNVKRDCVQWIKEWFEKNGPDCNAVVGISGGTDSTVVAALCVEALGKDRVIGVLMPNGIQTDIADAKKLVHFLNIKFVEANIEDAVQGILNNITTITYNTSDPDSDDFLPTSEQTKINLPPRVRMATLYAVSQSVNGRVANTCNLSEDWVGYSTRYGDSVGDFSPLSKLTKTEVKEIGKIMGLPIDLIEKTPSDGLCGKTDEENLGFTYDVLDRYIRSGIIEDKKIKEKIDKLHEKNLFKLQLMPCFEYPCNQSYAYNIGHFTRKQPKKITVCSDFSELKETMMSTYNSLMFDENKIIVLKNTICCLLDLLDKQYKE